jgi:hypothetical protein
VVLTPTPKVQPSSSSIRWSQMVLDWIHAHGLRQPRRDSNSIFDVSMIRNHGHETFRYDSLIQPRLYSTGPSTALGMSLTPQAGSLPVASTPPPSARRTLVVFSRIPSHVSASHPSIRHDTTWQAQSHQEPTSRTAEPPRARVCFIYSTNQALICAHHAYRSSPIGARDKSTWSRPSHTFAMRLALCYSCNLPTTQSALYKLQPGRRRRPTRQLRLAVSSGVQLIRNAPSDLSDNFLIK